jgi:hypothetical protein
MKFKRDYNMQNRRKDARLVMLYKIDRMLVAINKENRLIPTGRKTRKSHNRYHPPVLTPGKCHSFQERYETGTY